MTSTGLDVIPDMECTFWPDGWPTWLGGTGQEWLPCCQAHDTVEMTTRSAVELGACVAKVSPVMGLIMMVGVLVFGPIYLAFRRKRRTQ